MITPDTWKYGEVPGGHYVRCPTGTRPPNDVVICELKNSRGHDAEDNGKFIAAAGTTANEIEGDSLSMIEDLPDLVEALRAPEHDVDAADLILEAVECESSRKETLRDLVSTIKDFLDAED